MLFLKNSNAGRNREFADHKTLSTDGQMRSLDKVKLYIFTTPILMATKLDKVITYRKDLPLIKLLDLLITCF